MHRIESRNNYGNSSVVELNDNEQDYIDQDKSKIPVIVMDQHHDAYKMIRRYIDKVKLLPENGNTIIHLDAHVDELVPEELQIRPKLESKSTRFRLFGDLGIENWIKNAVNDKCFNHVIWVKPPWALQTEDGHCTLDNGVTLDIKTLGKSVIDNSQEEDIEGFKAMFEKYLSPSDPYILDIEYSFFSSDSPFTKDYTKAVDYYPKVKELFKFDIPENKNDIDIEKSSNDRNQKLEILYDIFVHLDKHRILPSNVTDDAKELYQKVEELQQYLLEFYPDDRIQWKSIYDAGVVANDYILPVHHSSEEDIKKMFDCVAKMLDTLPNPPKMITIAIMYEYDRYTPLKTHEFISNMLKEFFEERYENVEFEYLDY